MWCWTLSKPFPTPITPVRLVGPLDMQGLTISPTGHLAIWASEKTWQGTVSKVHVGKPIQFTDQNRSPEDESPPVPEPFELIQTQRVQEAAFSPDGAKLLIWTADSGPQVIQPLGAGANPPGTARVWDPVSGTPLTAPIKYRQSIRGAKFVQNGAGLLVWGEEPVVQHWEIVPSKLPETADKPAFIFEKYDETTSSDKSIVIRSQYVNESQKHRFVMSHNSKPDGSVVTDRKRPVMGIRFTGHAKNMLEWGGEAGAGFVCLWDMEKQSLLTPFYAHPLKVQYAVSNSTDSKILTTTLSTSSGYSPSMKVHLWDVLSNIELMEPLVLHEGAHAGFGSTELEIDVPTNDKWTRFHIDPVPVLSSDDPRWDVVLRTGTYLNDVGEMVRLSHEELQKLRSLSPLERPSFHEWSKGYATQELKFTPMTL
jgi:hypothetical protein